MKRFVFESVLFLLILFFIPTIETVYLLINDNYKETVAGKEVYHSIYKSSLKNDSKKILIGDSVGNQLFMNTEYNDTINSLACNQAIGLVGQYLLLNKYLEQGNKVEEVFLIYRPFSFSNNLDQKFTYHYFLKPFYTKEFLPLLNSTVRDQINKIPKVNLCQLPYVVTSNWAPSLKVVKEKEKTFLSPISIDYLKKIKELSFKFKFKLKILPAPMIDTSKIIIEQMDKSEISENNFDKEFKNYFESIIYLPENKFLDKVHLKEPIIYTNYYKQNFLLKK
jgi:hypothetical protein